MIPALQLKLSDLVEEYNQKYENIDSALKASEEAQNKIRMASVIGSTYGDRLDLGSPSSHEMKRSLLKSAWQRVYSGLNIDRIASASDKKLFQQSMENPAPFTLENIRATFGDYVSDPRGNILRGLAEVFCSLDQAYKSHDKVKIGVQGLPKRVILTNVKSYGSWGRDRLRDIINALAAYQNKPLAEYNEIYDFIDGRKSLKETRGVSLKTFRNGNGHLIFEPQELKDINRALAEYYGDILADCTDKPNEKQKSTAVSKDLQYYPTPKSVVDRVLSDIYKLKGQKVLEPSCGCGRFMDAIRTEGAEVFGIEFDAGRAQQARSKGHNVLTANFLETAPNPIYDRVIMNPPFYGRHYAQHVSHALKFLKKSGILTAILPCTARYDHGLLDGKWNDLPFGSFSESGTNINTTVLTIVV